MKNLVTILLIALSTISHSQEVPDKYSSIWNTILDFDYTAASKMLETEIKKNPNDPWLYWMMAETKDFGDKTALTLLEKAISLNKDFGLAHFDLGQRLSSDPTKFNEAEFHLSKAIQITPDDQFSYVERADLYLSQKMYDKAISDALSAKKIEPENSSFSDRIIIRALHDQDKKEDLKKFLATYDINDAGAPDANFHQFLGKIYESFGDAKNACTAYREVLTDLEFMDEKPSQEILEKLKKCK